MRRMAIVAFAITGANAALALAYGYMIGQRSRRKSRHALTQLIVQRNSRGRIEPSGAAKLMPWPCDRPVSYASRGNRKFLRESKPLGLWIGRLDHGPTVRATSEITFSNVPSLWKPSLFRGPIPATPRIGDIGDHVG